MTTNQTIDGVPRELLRWVHDFINDGLPLDKEEASVSDQLRALLDSPAQKDWEGLHAAMQLQRDHWRDRAQNPAAQPQGGVTHWANPDHVETITAELKAHNLSLGGAPAAAVTRYTIALGPVIQAHGEPLAEALMLAEKVRDSSLGMQRKRLSELLAYLYRAASSTEQPAPAAVEPILVEAVAVTRECDEEGLRLEWLLEGGIAALEHPGTVLLVAQGTLTSDTGSGYVYPARNPEDDE